MSHFCTSRLALIYSYPLLAAHLLDPGCDTSKHWAVCSFKSNIKTLSRPGQLRYTDALSSALSTLCAMDTGGLEEDITPTNHHGGAAEIASLDRSETP